MPISEAQLTTWNALGATAGSRDTYNAVKNALETNRGSFADPIEVILQGSYGNDTNVHGIESDVDVVIKCTQTYYSNKHTLPPQQLALHDGFFGAATYLYPAFKQDVVNVLTRAFPGSISLGTKTIKIAPAGNRRKADVLPAFVYKKFDSFTGQYSQPRIEGIAFLNQLNQVVDNYPVQHSARCTAKHQDTQENFKKIVRIFKNLRKRLIEERRIAEGTAPSYFIEGLLFNVPNHLLIGSTWQEIIANVLEWLRTAHMNQFICPNGEQILLSDFGNGWNSTHAATFVAAAIDYWNHA